MEEFNTRKITTEDLGEFMGQIIDIFEDFLEAHGINIPNEEKDDDGEETTAIIYGSDYGELQTAIEDTLSRWELSEDWR